MKHNLSRINKMFGLVLGGFLNKRKLSETEQTLPSDLTHVQTSGLS